jgi:DNA-binding IclR family transcriptional regulator
MSNVPGATRALAILQALGRAGSPMPAAAIAKKLGLPRSSTYHLLAAMEQDGFVIHFPEEQRWGLGVSAFELGSAYLRHDPLERLARPLLARLVRDSEKKIAAVAQLGILQNSSKSTDVLYLAKELPHHPVTIVTEVGVRLPAHLTASGKAILCQLDAKQVRAMYAGTTTLVTRTGKGPATIKDLVSDLQIAKANGFSFEESFVTEGYSSIAVSVINHLNMPVAALAMTFRAEDQKPETKEFLVMLLKQAAAELSKRLGSH